MQAGPCNRSRGHSREVANSLPSALQNDLDTQEVALLHGLPLEVCMDVLREGPLRGGSLQQRVRLVVARSLPPDLMSHLQQQEAYGWDELDSSHGHLA